MVGNLQGDENFAALFNAIPDPVVILDSKGNFLDLSEKALIALGYTKEELLNKNVFLTNIINNKARATTIANLTRRMLGMSVAPYVIEVLSKDKRKIFFELNATRIKYDGKQADIVIFRDVNERQRMQEAIEEEQERFRDVAKSTGDWIWETDANGTYTYSSPIVEQILGYTPEEVIGKKIVDFLPSEDVEQIANLIGKVFASKERFLGFAIRAVCKNGKIVFLEKNAIPMLVNEGELLGYRGLYRDVSERREMEQKLMKTERFATIGELSAMIAHDLRNPLQGIANGVYFLKSKIKEPNDPTTREVFGLLEEAVQYSNKIVGDLLDYSKEIHLDLQDTSPAAVVNDSLSVNNVPNNVLVNTRVTESIVLMDADKMKRVFVNLIKNSLDAMPNGGKLTIASLEVDTHIHLFFSDTGAGMSKETMDKLWTPLFTTKAKGMGFGLPICKRIVEAHGGKILVNSIFGQGTTFTLIMPIRAQNCGGVDLWVNHPESLS